MDWSVCCLSGSKSLYKVNPFEIMIKRLIHAPQKSLSISEMRVGSAPIKPTGSKKSKLINTNKTQQPVKKSMSQCWSSLHAGVSHLNCLTMNRHNAAIRSLMICIHRPNAILK